MRAAVAACVRDARSIGLLREITQGAAGLEETCSGIGEDFAGRNAEKGGFAAAVTTDKTDPFAGRDRKSHAIEQRFPAKRQSDVLQEKKRRRCHVRKVRGTASSCKMLEQAVLPKRTLYGVQGTGTPPVMA